MQVSTLRYWSPSVCSKRRKEKTEKPKHRRKKTPHIINKIENLLLITLRHSAYSCKSRLAINMSGTTGVEEKCSGTELHGNKKKKTNNFITLSKLN